VRLTPVLASAMVDQLRSHVNFSSSVSADCPSAALFMSPTATRPSSVDVT
jgi:hypothetical protein